MTQLHTADVARFFVEIAVADAEGEQLTVSRTKKLKRVLYALTVAPPDITAGDDYQIDINYVGYVKKNIDDLEVFIPFHLRRFFPRDSLLLELVGAAKTLVLNETNPICISGSATFLGAFRSISDLDFCEYYLVAPMQTAAKHLQSKWTKKFTNRGAAELE